MDTIFPSYHSYTIVR
ncbi:hypothetical protein F383_16348 [Gossypium arboreum]|uniref:Uncharacterized protein n=1 Tax=Gossypium arboreum TaxID=29729 RepID=A0A0B0PYB1_GOSAR|nr:hypothetical protein F383_16348 [Gossypium arboreum]